ncbi:hypothetical protein [Nocardia jinanensis]|uniref:hypothetical protein n=1 Tax=Nocardia jinanensis TaxID=382504 RepID=UPI0012E396AC|nr:hypothetical protein [Nocardia jinanensis]
MIEVGDQVRIGTSGESIFVVREGDPDEGGPGTVCPEPWTVNSSGAKCPTGCLESGMSVVPALL